MSKRLYNIYKVRARDCKLFLLALLTACCMACSGSGSDDGTDPVEPTPPPAVNEKAISFSSGLQEEQEVTSGGSGANSMTRASGLETSATSFIVYGYKNDGYDTGSYTSYQTVFPGFTVNWTDETANTTTSNTHDWEYVGVTTEQTIKYWDFSAKAYRYFAYALGTATADPATPVVPVTAGTVGGTPAVQTLSATVDASTDATIAAAPYFSELWFSTGHAADYPDKQFGQPVQLVFKKPFAQVTVKFMDSQGLQWAHDKIGSFSFKPSDSQYKVAEKGLFTVTYPLTGSETKEQFTATPTSDGCLDAGITGTSVSSCTKTVLPTGSSLGTFTVAVTLDGYEEKTAVVPAEYTNWKPGYEYTYIFKVSVDSDIVLEIVLVAVRRWTEGIVSSHHVYNW